ncbi:hypothetical protein MHB77_32000 [Paenibacillus sp. FSL K6-3166]|uniref:hypothetical protein n=1 Tax=unclassified Paenibacillus TaxID=185978 RepID=UPI001D662EA4|nr:hypothetical protein [Acinetobacter sp. CUI P1]
MNAGWMVFLSIVFSTLEIVMILSLSLLLFRISFRKKLDQIVLIGVILSYISFKMRDFGLTGWDTLLQIILMILALRMIFSIGWIYSVIIVAAGALALYSGIQFVVYWLITRSQGVQFLTQDGLSSGALLLQGGTVIIGFILAFLMNRFHWGVTFVPYDPKEPVELIGINKRIFIAAVCIIGAFMLSLIAIHFRLDTLIEISGLTLLILLVYILRLVFKKEFL